jgi:hypothetical protein
MRPQVFSVNVLTEGCQLLAILRPRIQTHIVDSLLQKLPGIESKAKFVQSYKIVNGRDSIALHGVLHRTTCAGPKSLLLQDQPGHRAECRLPVGGCRLLNIHPSRLRAAAINAMSIAMLRRMQGGFFVIDGIGSTFRRIHQSLLLASVARIDYGKDQKQGAKYSWSFERIGGAVCRTQVALRSVQDRRQVLTAVRRPGLKGGCSSPNAYCDGRGWSYRAFHR